jgi:NADPH-dependent curcumin reductase
MRGGAICRVLAFRHRDTHIGDIVSGFTGWQKYALLSHDQFEHESAYPSLKRPIDMLSLLGPSSLTAWVGMTKIDAPKEGETVVADFPEGRMQLSQWADVGQIKDDRNSA